MNFEPVSSQTLLDDHRRGHLLMYQKLRQVAAKLYILLQSDHLQQRDLNEMQRFHDNYLTCFVQDYPIISTHYRLGTKGGSLAMHIFMELSRAHWLLSYKKLADEKHTILNSAAVLDNVPMQLFSLSNCASEFWQSTDKLSIFKYGQREVIDALLMMTRRINEMPFQEDTLDDFRKLVHILYTRNSVFCCQTCSLAALNVEEMRDELPDGQYVANRDYINLCSIYFNCLFRRLYYFDKLSDNIEVVVLPDDSAECIEHWVEADICHSLGTEGIEDTYAMACDRSFDFPGDEEWFKYKYPARPSEKGPILDCIRPVQAKMYFSAGMITKDPILAAAHGFRADHQGVSARLFVLMAVDQWFRSVYGAQWLNAVLINNSDIEISDVKLRKCKFPCLLQVLTGFWVYSRGKIYPTNNIYQTVYMWFYILQRDYSGKLLQIDLSAQLKTLLTSRQDIDKEYLL